MTGAEVKVDGLTTLQATLDRFGASLSNMPEATAANATTVLNDARRRAPVKSGALVSSGFALSDGKSSTAGFSAAHAGPIQFGVGPRVGLRGPHNIRPRDYLFAAVPATEDAVTDRLTEAVESRLRRVKGA